MQQMYTHILTFLFRHQYFGDELLKSIEISYDEDTYKLVRDLGIIIKPFSGGLHLLASNPELLNSNNDASPIQLYLNCKDPLYINYTELPEYSLADKLLYFNNLSVISDSKNQGFFLHNKEFVGENEIVQLSSGKIQIPNFNADKGYRFTDALGNVIDSQNLTKSSREHGSFVISHLPQGLILVKGLNEEIEKFYYNPKTIWKKPFGILEIFTKQLLQHYNENGKVEYSLNFKNRETIWKYFLIDPVYQKFNNLSIINKSKEQVFNPPQKKQVSNFEALVFESKNKIPLAEISDENYQLLDSYEPGTGKGKIILKNLPKASSEQLFMNDAKSTGTIYSHIYI